MNFERLPAELAAAMMQKCQLSTISKLKKTNSCINKLIQRNKLDQINVNQIRFVQDYSGQKVVVAITGASKLGNTSFFEVSCNFPENIEDPKPAGHKIVHQILRFIKSLKYIQFRYFDIDESFVKILRESRNSWKGVSLDIHLCRYVIPKEDLKPFWIMFNSVVNSIVDFKENLQEIYTDEMLSQILPKVTFNTDLKGINVPLTDRYLKILAETKPAIFCLRNSISNFTLDGIKQLFTTIVKNRDSTVDYWIIGSVRMNPTTVLDELAVLRSEYCKVSPRWIFRGYQIRVEYQKEGTDSIGILAIEAYED